MQLQEDDRLNTYGHGHAAGGHSLGLPTRPSTAPVCEKKDLATLAGLRRPHDSSTSEDSSQHAPYAVHTLAAATTVLASPTSILDSYTRPSIDAAMTTSAVHVDSLARHTHAHPLLQRSGNSPTHLLARYEDPSRLHGQQDDDDTAFAISSDHAPFNDEDATTRIPQPALAMPPNTSKRLPKPPRPPRIRPLSNTSSFGSLISHDHDGLGDDAQAAWATVSSSAETALPDRITPSSAQEIGAVTAASTASSQALWHHSLERTTSNASIGSISRHGRSNIGASPSPYSTSAPLNAIPSSSSSGSSYFFSTPGRSEMLESSEPFPMKRSHSLHRGDFDVHLKLQRQASVRSQADSVKQGAGLEVFGSAADARASVYTMQTSASDWARERETEMQDSKSGLFDLEDELRGSTSSTSSHGHNGRQPQARPPEPLARTLSIRKTGVPAGNEIRSRTGALEEERYLSSSSSGSIVAVSQPPSPMRSVQAGPASSLQAPVSPNLLRPQNSIPRPMTPSSASSLSGFGVGITSDDAIYPIVESAPPSGATSTSIPVPSPTTQLPQASPSALNSAIPPSRWSTARSYVRRNTASSVRSLNKQASKGSLNEKPFGSRQELRHAQSLASLKHDERLSAASVVPAGHVGMHSSYSASGHASMSHDELASLSYADFDSSARSHASAYNSAYTSNANSYISRDSVGEDEFEELVARAGPRDQRLFGLGIPSLPAGLPSGSLDSAFSSQAVEVAESGQGTVVRALPTQALEDLVIPTTTTHLILSGVGQPLHLHQILQEALPRVAQTLLVLDISFCSLDAIPPAVALCASLEELNISGNPIASETLPPFLSVLQSLRVLLADNCGISALAHPFIHLSRLHTIALRHNNIKFLPSWLSCLSSSLEILLLDNNPLYGDYADLVGTCAQANLPWDNPAASDSDATSPGSEAEGFRQTEASKSSVSAVSSSANANGMPEDVAGLACGTTSPAFSSSRASLASRTSSVRLAISRSFRHLDESPSVSPVQSLLLADSASQASTARRRVSILRPMKSTGDLGSPQPSIHDLVHSPSFPDSSPFPASPATSSVTSPNAFPRLASQAATLPNRRTLVGTLTGRRDRKASRGMTAMEFLAADEQKTRHSRLESGPSLGRTAPPSDKMTPPVPPRSEDKLKESKSGFFKKLSLAGKRKKSTSIVQQDQAPVSSSLAHATAGLPDFELAKPPFLGSHSLRSTSAPTAPLHGTKILDTDQIEDPQSRLPELPGNRLASYSSANSSFRDSKRFRKWSIPAPLLRAKQDQQVSAKRRSYLMLNSVLPPVLSPGPLAVSFNRASLEDYTIHAKPKVALPRQDHAPPEAAMEYLQTTSTAPEADAEIQNVSDNWSPSARKAMLAPLMAYLQDLYDLSRQYPLAATQRSGPVTIASQNGYDIQRENKKGSSAALSSASSFRDRSSGYESSKGDSTALTSPSSTNGMPNKIKEDPVKRERVIAEIVASEKSYLAGLQQLVDLYIQPASAPLRSSNGGSRETVVSQTERSAIFSVAESITQFHASVFLPRLEGAAGSVIADRKSASSLEESTLMKSAIAIAQVFLDHVAFLKLYHAYCLNFDTALDKLATWKSYGSANANLGTPPLPTSGASSGSNLTSSQKKRIRHLLKTARRDPRHEHQIDLQSYLLMPIQRIPRYKLLLEVLVECTGSENGSERSEPTLQAALTAISALANEMNERKRDNEGRKRLLYWQAKLIKFKSPLVQPHRTVLKEGTMMLERIVKRDATVVSNSVGSSVSGAIAQASLMQIPVLQVEKETRSLIYVLCNDILIFVSSPPLDGDQYEAFTVLRLGKSLGGRDQPASVFGPPNRLRILDDRAILYLTCPDEASAEACRDLINRQSLQNNINSTVSEDYFVV